MSLWCAPLSPYPPSAGIPPPLNTVTWCQTRWAGGVRHSGRVVSDAVGGWCQTRRAGGVRCGGRVVSDAVGEWCQTRWAGSVRHRPPPTRSQTVM
ncbi:MAG: hypothetical protein LBK25_05020 [Treponema sp.]|nr:hypothetical protein [Treponema sp.]